MDTPLLTTLADAAEFLGLHDVPYALIGGLAVSLRGQTRLTVDVDMVIGCDVPTALDLLKQVSTSPFMPLFSGASEVVQQSMILPLRHRQTGVKLDLAIGTSGFEKQVLERATPIELAKQSIWVATAEDLIIMKVLAGRPQDQQDVDGIARAHRDELEWTYCLNTAKLLEEALDIDLVQRIEDLRSEE